MPTTTSHTHSVELAAPPAVIFPWLVTPSAIWLRRRLAGVLHGGAPDIYEPPHRLRLGDTRYVAKAGPLPFRMDTTIEFRVEPLGDGSIAHDRNSRRGQRAPSPPRSNSAPAFHSGRSS